jgi:hypothetical protein
MQAICRRSDALEVAEHPSGLENVEDFGVERAFALVLEVMDRK